MTNDFQRSQRLPAHAETLASLALDANAAARMEAQATRLHMQGRKRGKLFLAPVMADSAMDIMLCLAVGEFQGISVSAAALATANLLSRAETDAFIDRLVQAGLAVITGVAPEGRAVGLTPLGSARMRGFLNDYPDV